jgi:hypothetical protein
VNEPHVKNVRSFATKKKGIVNLQNDEEEPRLVSPPFSREAEPSVAQINAMTRNTRRKGIRRSLVPRNQKTERFGAEK